jgi:hypothetical protein
VAAAALEHFSEAKDVLSPNGARLCGPESLFFIGFISASLVLTLLENFPFLRRKI